MSNSELAIEQIVEEVDKVCVIARWDFAVGKYGSKWNNDFNNGLEENIWVK